MTIPTVRCPICLDEYPWPDNPPLFEYKDGDYVRLSQTTQAGGTAKGLEIAQNAYVECPNPSQDIDQHYLPALYATFHKPIVVGLVGGSESGKSHLLAAMSAAIEGAGLQDLGLTVLQLDFRRHQIYFRDHVKPLREGRPLRSTLAQENAVIYADALLIRSGENTWPITFFDVAGGDLAKYDSNATRFLRAANGLIFVVDPEQALAESNKPLTDPTFAMVLSKLGVQDKVSVPAAIVLTKADRYRFREPVSNWLNHPSARRVDADLIRQESRDVYGFLYQHDAQAWLRPFHECRRCTLHFASATGGDAVAGEYPIGTSPRRVLEPLIALLAMCEVITGREAGKVGRS